MSSSRSEELRSCDVSKSPDPHAFQVEIPALVGQKYKLNSQQVGLQFVAALIGSGLGEPLAGFGSDRFMEWRTRRAQGKREPEMRLPVALPGFIISVSSEYRSSHTRGA